VELRAGIKLASYEILSRIGAGEDGEVYRGRDTALNQDVAIRVLPQQLTENPKNRQQLEQEVLTLSKLAHPNICTLRTLCRHYGIDFLVMDYLEGETLEVRMAKGPFKPEELLGIAMQVADGLGAAQRQGISHRNLRPSSIMLTAGGAKLLDFGLAGSAAAVDDDSTESPTDEPPMDAAETVRGRLCYMAPEQLRGKPGDARSDVFAFGAVLYEMATGKQAFPGQTAEEVTAAVLQREPEPVSAFDPLMPPALDQLVRICLAKNPEERLPSASPLKLLLEWIRDGCWGNVAPIVREKRSRSRERVAWLITVAAVAVAAAMVAASLLRQAVVKPPTRVEAAINLPPTLMLGSRNASIAFSPSGKELVLDPGTRGATQQLWLRATDSSTFRPLAGTQGATYPFWSPDGRSIGFFAGDQLKKIDLRTGNVLTICGVEAGQGGTWNRQGTIVFAPARFGGLYRVSAEGGTPIQVSVPGGASISQRLPQFLPGGQRVLYYSGTPNPSQTDGIYVLNLTTGQSQLLVHTHSAGKYVAPGYLAFMRGDNLMLQRFRAPRLLLSGAPFSVAQGVAFNSASEAGIFSFSRDGLLVYEPNIPVPISQLTWLSLDGKKLGTVGQPARFAWAAISPDGTQAVAEVSNGSGAYPLWIYNLKSGAKRRFTVAASSFSDPLWSPDGHQIVFQREDLGTFYRKSVRGDSPAVPFLTLKGAWAMSDWSPDGRLIAMENQGADGWNIWMLPMMGKRKPYAFLSVPHNKLYGTFSPDGHWLSFISDQSGRPELYVVPFPGGGKEEQVSRDGAVYGGWVPGQQELAYVTASDKLTIVKVRSRGKRLLLGKPEIVLGGRPFPEFALSAAMGATAPDFFSPDGKRLLLPIAVGKNRARTLTLVGNWRTRKQKS
jgi:serine/threonine protein kinase